MRRLRKRHLVDFWVISVVILVAVNYGCTSKSGRNPAGYGSYYYGSYPGYNYISYPTSSPPWERREQLRKLNIERITCAWWTEASEDGEWTDEASGYTVRDCGNGDSTVCTGNTKCKAVMRTKSGTVKFDFFLEDVMCSSERERCKVATDCVLDGGILKTVKVKRDPNAEKVMKLSPKKLPSGFTHQ